MCESVFVCVQLMIDYSLHRCHPILFCFSKGDENLIEKKKKRIKCTCLNKEGQLDSKAIHILQERL
jgi:hypothetical protein